MKELIPQEVIEQKILLIRGHKVMLDRDLAILYGVSTKRLNEQVRRNLKRFPSDFMFQLSEEEFASLRSLFATLKTGRGKHRKYLPYVFTEQGVAMLSSVLNSDRNPWGRPRRGHPSATNRAIKNKILRLRLVLRQAQDETSLRMTQLVLLIPPRVKFIFYRAVKIPTDLEHLSRNFGPSL